MTAREMVAEQALSLSTDDRVYLLDRLEQSLIPEVMHAASEIIDGDMLAVELQRRADAYHSGATTSIDAFEFIAELRRQRHAESVR
jgi:putative addiction module component (TIGR02574 family)